MNPNLQKLLFVGGMLGGVIATGVIALASAIITKAKA